jgi:integrase
MSSAGEVDATKEALVDRAYDLEVTDSQSVDSIKSALDAVDDDSVLYLSEAINLYLDAHQPPIVTQQTYTTKKVRLGELKAYLGVDLDIRNITGQQASQYVTQDLLKRKRQDGRKWAPRTVRYHITDLSTFFSWFVMQEAIATNPFKGKASLVKESKRGTTSLTEPRPWSPEELLKFAEGAPAADQHYRLVFFMLGLYTGCRLNELAGLKLKDVHEGYIKITSGKTKSALRDVPLHPLLVPLVDHLRQASTDEYLIPGLRRGGENDKRGHYVSKRFTHMRRKLGVTDPGCRYHSLRANFITALEQARVPVNEIQTLVDHKRPSLALGGYSGGVDADRLRENVALVTFGRPVDSLVTRRVGELLAEASG